MTHYLLSVHSVEGEARDPMTEEEMRQFMERVGVLEEEMKSAGAWVFGGALHDPDTATVARVSDNEVLTTDGRSDDRRDNGEEPCGRVEAQPRTDERASCCRHEPRELGRS